MKIVFFYRAPVFQYSVERVFADLRRHLPEDVEQSEYAVPYRTSNNFLKIAANIWLAKRHESELNHITGDVHYLCALLSKRRTILTVLDTKYIDRTDKSRLKLLLYRLLYIWLPARRCAHLVFISKAAMDHFRQYQAVPEDRCSVIPVCISDEFRFAPKPFPARPAILIIGTAYNKNLRRSFEALASVDCTLRIIGALEDEHVSLLRALHIDYSCVSDIDDAQVVQEYVNADLLLFASLSEGFGMPIVEAQATGRPVVTSDRSPMRDVAGGAAVLVDPEDPASIRDGIGKILTDPDLRRELVQKGLQNARQYGGESAAAAYARLYRTLHQSVRQR